MRGLILPKCSLRDGHRHDFSKRTGRKLDKTIGLKTVRISSRLAMEDSYIHHVGDSNIRYLPRNDSGNGSQLERGVIDTAVVWSSRGNARWSLEVTMVAWFRAGTYQNNLGTLS